MTAEENKLRRQLVPVSEDEADTIMHCLQLCASNLESNCRRCPYRMRHDESRDMGCCDLLMAKASELIRALKHPDARLIGLKAASRASSCWVQIRKGRKADLILTKFIGESDNWVDFWEYYTFPKKTLGLDWRIWSAQPKPALMCRPWRAYET